MAGSVVLQSAVMRLASLASLWGEGGVGSGWRIMTQGKGSRVGVPLRKVHVALKSGAWWRHICLRWEPVTQESPRVSVTL